MSKKLVFLMVGLVVLISLAIALKPKETPSVADDTTSEKSEGIAATGAYAENKEKLKSGEPQVMPSENMIVAGKTDGKPASDEAKAAAAKPIMDLVPLLEDYRNEIAANPHGAPPSLKKFSEAMAVKMEPALKDPSAARDLIPQLEECVKGASISAVQQSCLVNAQRLSQKHPALAAQVQAIEEAAPKEVRKRAMLMDPTRKQ